MKKKNHVKRTLLTKNFNLFQLIKQVFLGLFSTFKDSCKGRKLKKLKKNNYIIYYIFFHVDLFSEVKNIKL